MTQTKKSKNDIKWQCPICGDIRYQQYGGTPVSGTKFTNEVPSPTTVIFGRHYMCKGCSVFFSNPYLFNALKINKEKK